MALENDRAGSPYGIFTTTPEIPVGDYSIKLTVTDKVSGGFATKTGTVTLK